MKLTFESYAMKVLDQLAQIPDVRLGNNTMYPFTQLLMTALAAFYSKAPSLRRFLGSFFEYRGNYGVDALLASLHKGPDGVYMSRRIPTDNHIRKQLDGLEPYALNQAIWETLVWTDRVDPRQYRYGDMTVLMPYLGWHYASHRVHCPVCITRVYPSERRGDDMVEHFHSFFGISMCPLKRGLPVPQLPPEYLFATDYPEVTPGMHFRTRRATNAPRPNLAAALKRKLARDPDKAYIEAAKPFFVLHGHFGDWDCVETVGDTPYVLIPNETEDKRIKEANPDLYRTIMDEIQPPEEGGKGRAKVPDIYTRDLGPVLRQCGVKPTKSFTRLVEWDPVPPPAIPIEELRGKKSRFLSRMAFTNLAVEPPCDTNLPGRPGASPLARLLDSIHYMDVTKTMEKAGFGFMKKFGHGQITLSEVFCSLNILAANLEILNNL